MKHFNILKWNTSLLSNVISETAPALLLTALGLSESIRIVLYTSVSANNAQIYTNNEKLRLTRSLPKRTPLTPSH